MFHQLRSERRGGGVALFTRGIFKAQRLEVDIPEGVEGLWVRLSPPSHPRHTANIIYGLFYHPPRAPTHELLIDHIINTGDSLRTRYHSSKLVICGDFNQLDVSDIKDHLNLVQVVDFPTHEQNTLDLILTDMADQYLPPQPLPPVGRSNHLSVQWLPAATTPHPHQPTTRTYRPTPDSAVRQFGQWMVRYPWTEVLTVTDVNDKWENFVATSTLAYEHHFPEKTVTLHPADVPWITPRVKRLMRQRNRAFHTGAREYRQLRNTVIREIKVAKKEYYPTKIHHLKDSNSSQWYSRVRQLCGMGKQTTAFPCTAGHTDQQACHLINDHFSAICQSLPCLDSAQLPAFLPSPSPPPFVHEY